MVSCMCILRGRLSSTTKGPELSPKEMCPEMRWELMARILSRPPRAAKTLATISSAVSVLGVWAGSGTGRTENDAKIQQIATIRTVFVMFCIDNAPFRRDLERGTQV